MAEQNKTRASLMQGMNLAGQKYFQVPYNIPSTFGNFYVGSPTETVSDFVPLPLDYIQEDMANMQTDYDTAALTAQEQPDVLKNMVQAAPFNSEFRDKLLKEYALNDKAEKWAKELAYNPLAAEKIARDVRGLSSKFISDPRTEAIKQEYQKYLNTIQKSKYQTGWSNFWNDGDKSWNQLDPTLSPADYTEDDHMTYVKNNYIKDLKENIRTSLSGKGITDIKEVNGIIYYTDKGTNLLQQINPDDPNDPFVKQALQGLATEMYNDPHPQIERIAKPQRGIDNLEKAYEFIKNLHANQFYRRSIVKPGDDKIISSPKSGDDGGEESEKPLPLEAFDLPSVPSTEAHPNTYADLTSSVESSTNSMVGQDANNATYTPVRAIADAKRVFPNLSWDKVKEGDLISYEGKPFVHTVNLDPSITNGITDEPNLTINGTVSYKMQAQGDFLVPVIDKVNAVYNDGTPLSQPEITAIEMKLRDKTIKARNQLADKKEVDKRIEEKALEEYNNIDPEKAIYKNNENNRIIGEALKNNLISPDFKGTAKTKTVIENGKPVQKTTTEFVAYNPKDIQKWIDENPDKVKTILGQLADDDIKDEVVSKYYESKLTGLNVITFKQNEGKQMTSTEIHPLSKVESDINGKLGGYKKVGTGDDETWEFVGGNKSFFKSVFSSATLRSLDKGLNGKSMTSLNLTGEEAIKNGVRLSIDGMAIDNQGKWVYVGTVDVMNPKADKAYKKVDGQTVTFPLNEGSSKAKFAEALGLTNESGNNTGEAFIQTLGMILNGSQRGTIPNIDNNTPWIPGAKQISFEKLQKGGQDGAGDKTVVRVDFGGGQVKTLEADSPGEASMQLWGLRNSAIQYQKSLSGTGGSSGGKSLNLFQKN